MKATAKTDEALWRVINKILDLDENFPLPGTFVESKNTHIDGIRAHRGIDGDIYYRLTDQGKDVTVGMNCDRFLQCVPLMLTPKEFASLTGTDAPATESHVTRVAFFTDYNAYDADCGSIIGSMGYTFGGDYEASRRDVGPDETVEAVLKEYTDELRESCREMYDKNNEEDGYIPLYTIEKHEFDTTVNEHGEVIDEDLKEKTNFLTFALCSKETAEKYGFLGDDCKVDEFISEN